MELVVSFSGCYTFEPALGCHCQQRPTNIRLILQVGTFNNHEHLCQHTSCSINKGLLSQIGSYTDSSGRKKIFLFFFISRTKKGKKKKERLNKMWMQRNWLSYTFTCLKISIIDLVILKVSWDLWNFKFKTLVPLGHPKKILYCNYVVCVRRGTTHIWRIVKCLKSSRHQEYHQHNFLSQQIL